MNPPHHRGRWLGRAWVAFLLLWLQGTALVLAASDVLHREAHDARDQAHHQCLATLFHAGQVESSEPPLLHPAAPTFFVLRAGPEPVQPLPCGRHELPPGRGPPL